MMKPSVIQTTLSLVLAVSAVSSALAAPAINPRGQPLGYIGPIELSDSDLSSGNVKAYRGWFDNGGWQGDLVEYTVGSTGSINTTVDLSKPSPTETGEHWSAHAQFAAHENGDLSWNNRKIITAKGSLLDTQTPFRWGNLSNWQKNRIDPLSISESTSGVLNFLRGDRSQEKPSGPYRMRFTMLGDIVHSNPVYVGAPNEDITDAGYADFAADNASREPRVYVGANDGMLHAFNANNGKEEWAYVPVGITWYLPSLAAVAYQHKYFVDGALNVRDAKIGNNWRTLLAGGYGAGGQGLYILDVTGADLSNENSTTGDDKKLIKEYLGGNNDKDLGFVFGQSKIVKLNDDKWYVVNGNGVSSKNGKAVLYLIRLDDKQIVRISTQAGSTSSPNGLSAPVLIDRNEDGKVDFAYAGDLDGDLWKFNLEAPLPKDWKVEYKLFDGTAAQPITTAPDITRHVKYGFQLLFATGQLYSASDVTNASVQSIYGVWDNGYAQNDLTGPLTLSELSSAIEYSNNEKTATVKNFVNTQEIDYDFNHGWRLNLPAGQRVLVTPQLRGGRLKTTVTNPSNNENWLLEVTFDDGRAEDAPIYDLNQSGTLTSADLFDGNGDDDVDDLSDVPMAWKRENGFASRVEIARLSAGVDTLFLNTLRPIVTPVVEPPPPEPVIPPLVGEPPPPFVVPPVCPSPCIGGFGSGHVDVDYDIQWGGSTSKHEHEYDVKVNRTYVDYFDIEATGANRPVNSAKKNFARKKGGNGTSKLKSLDSTFNEHNTSLIVMLANADMSPGGVITLGTKSYNVVYYQRMLQKAMAEWNGNPNTLKDPAGYPLAFTINELKANNGTLRSSFHQNAILAGGLIGTETGCVKSSPNITRGRWRNGALTLHVVRASLFNGLGQDNALDRITVQDPTDLQEAVILPTGDFVPLRDDRNGDGQIRFEDFEVYGGMRASSSTDFVYESTLFWHWKSVCYGDSRWEEIHESRTQGAYWGDFSDFLALNGFGSIQELVDRIEALQGCAAAGNQECKDELALLENMYELAVITQPGEEVPELITGGGTGNGDGTESFTTRNIMEGSAENVTITSGPNSKLGRRTWIDIKNE